MYVNEIGSSSEDVGIYVDLEYPHFVSGQNEEWKEIVRKDIQKFPNLTLKESYLFDKSDPKSLSSDDSQWKLWIPPELTNELTSRAHVPLQLAKFS